MGLCTSKNSDLDVVFSDPAGLDDSNNQANPENSNRGQGPNKLNSLNNRNHNYSSATSLPEHNNYNNNKANKQIINSNGPKPEIKFKTTNEVSSLSHSVSESSDVLNNLNTYNNGDTLNRLTRQALINSLPTIQDSNNNHSRTNTVNTDIYTDPNNNNSNSNNHNNTNNDNHNKHASNNNESTNNESNQTTNQKGLTSSNNNNNNNNKTHYPNPPLVDNVNDNNDNPPAKVKVDDGAVGLSQVISSHTKNNSNSFNSSLYLHNNENNDNVNLTDQREERILIFVQIFLVPKENSQAFDQKDKDSLFNPIHIFIKPLTQPYYYTHYHYTSYNNNNNNVNKHPNPFQRINQKFYDHLTKLSLNEPNTYYLNHDHKLTPKADNGKNNYLTSSSNNNNNNNNNVPKSLSISGHSHKRTLSLPPIFSLDEANNNYNYSFNNINDNLDGSQENENIKNKMISAPSSLPLNFLNPHDNSHIWINDYKKNSFNGMNGLNSSKHHRRTSSLDSNYMDSPNTLNNGMNISLNNEFFTNNDLDLNRIAAASPKVPLTPYRFGPFTKIINSSKLSRKKFNTAIHSIPRDKLIELEELWKSSTGRNDTCGLMNFNTFRSSFRGLFDKLGGNRLGLELFKSLQPSNGGIKFQNLIISLYMWNEGTHHDRLKMLFEMVDIFGMGSIGRNEIRNLIKNLSANSIRNQLLISNALKGQNGLEGYLFDNNTEDFVRLLQDRHPQFFDSLESHLDEVLLRFNKNHFNRIELNEWITVGSDFSMEDFLDLFDWKANTISSPF